MLNKNNAKNSKKVSKYSSTPSGRLGCGLSNFAQNKCNQSFQSACENITLKTAFTSFNELNISSEKKMNLNNEKSKFSNVINSYHFFLFKKELH